MNLFALIALLLTFTALLAHVIDRSLRLSTAVGLVGLSLAGSLLLVAVGKIGTPMRGWAASALAQVDFSQTLLNGMLSFLLFAGSLHVNIDELHDSKIAIASLATAAVLLSTFLIGGLTWLISGWLTLGLPLVTCLVFGALFSPTDPIAVMALLKAAKAPASLPTKIVGESLFNDGVGIGLRGFSWQETGILLLKEVGGGLALGGLCFLLLKSVDNYHVEVMLMLALVSGGYQVAQLLHAGGPLAIVTAGLLIGNYGRLEAISEKTRTSLDNFWELLDEILNVMLIGLQVLIIEFKPVYLLATALLIPLVLGARFVGVALPAGLMKLAGQGGLHLSLLTWGGLRGGVSIALALTLAAGPEHDLLMLATYGIVSFSILVQATTVPWLIRKTVPAEIALPERA